MSAVEQLEAAGEVLSPAVREVIFALEARIGELEARLGLNSTNSSLPPSADPPGVMRPVKSPTGKRRGAQPGHRGHFRSRVSLERVDQVVEHRPAVCCHCVASLTGAAEAGIPLVHQMAELPPVRALITEHRLLRLRCARCGTLTRGVLPPEVRGRAFGPRLGAFAALLAGRFHLSRRQTQSLLSDLLDVPPSLGSVQALTEETSAALFGAYREIRSAVRQSPVAAVDETGWRLRGKRRWTWVAVTPRATLFRLGRGRGSQDARRLLGSHFRGLVSSDRWGAYRQYPPGQRQLCWAHLKRDFQRLAESGGAAAGLGRWGVGECGRIFGLWHRVQGGVLTRKELARALVPVRWRMARLLKRGAGMEGKARALCRNVLTLWPALWSFIHHEGVEPTNNAAERALRKPVLWRKISFGSGSGRGMRFVERILTVSETCRQHQQSVLDYLTRALVAQRNGLPAPALLPTH
jgi:transposase